MNGESLDIKQPGLQRLKELFPELFAGSGKPIAGGKRQLWCLTLQLPTLNI